MNDIREQLRTANRRLANVIAGLSAKSETFNADLALIITEGLEVTRYHLTVAGAAADAGEPEAMRRHISTAHACQVLAQRLFHALALELGAPADSEFPTAAHLVDGLTDQLRELADAAGDTTRAAPCAEETDRPAIGATVFENINSSTIARDRLMPLLAQRPSFATAAAITAASLAAAASGTTPRAWLRSLADWLPDTVDTTREVAHLGANAYALKAFLASAGRIVLAQCDTWTDDGTLIGPYADILFAGDEAE
jgi:hypothetical protein